MAHVARAFVMLAASLSTSASAQVLSKATIDAFKASPRGVGFRSVSEPKPKRASLWTTTLPVTFSRIEKVGSAWRVGANMSIGASFVFITGKATPQADGSYRLEPEFMIGPVANFGLTAGDTSGVVSTLMLGGTIGFSSFAVLGGYDVLRSRAIIGIGVQIQSLTFTQSLTKLTGLN